MYYIVYIVCYIVICKVVELCNIVTVQFFTENLFEMQMVTRNGGCIFDKQSLRTTQDAEVQSRLAR